MSSKSCFMMLLGFVFLFSMERTEANELAAQNAGTYLYVVNGTNMPLQFSLYYETTAGVRGKFDSSKILIPGKVTKWRFNPGKIIRTSKKGVINFYHVGLVGTNPRTGKRYVWGSVGGQGMFGNEKETIEHDSGVQQLYRNIVVKPTGSLR
jgi:hypothetical protein